MKRFSSVWVILFLSALSSTLQAQTSAELAAFEKEIRPLLLNRCGACHGATKQESGVRFDQRTGAFRKLDSGSVIVPGAPEQSRLIQVLKHDDFDVQMPPKKKLPAAEIARLTQWVKQGAPWPEDHSGKTSGGQSHWAFQPISSPTIPQVKGQSLVRNPIDAFILARLEAEGLSLSESADQRTLLRRAGVKLLGLPPTWNEVRQFENDPAPDAWERAIDRLLSSPQYGERWARHWLDVARYADTKGYVFTEEIRYPFAYTYRNYVIDAFNADLPVDRFITEQLAADQLNLGEQTEPLAALGFLTVGRRFRNSENEIIDDRIDVVTRGLMGLTVSCARCHDHKFDPIPTADYYSLYGVFASCEEPKELPLIGTPRPTPEYLAYRQEFEKREQAYLTYREAQSEVLRNSWREQAVDYLLKVMQLHRSGKNDPPVNFNTTETKSQVVNLWRSYWARNRNTFPAVTEPWYRLLGAPAENYEQHASRILADLKQQEKINPVLLEALQTPPVKTAADVARRYAELFQNVHQEWEQLQQTAAETNSPPPKGLPDPQRDQLLQFFTGNGSPLSLPTEAVANLFPRDKRDQLRKLKRLLDQWQVTSPAAPARAMVLVDRLNLYDPRVFIRGNPARKGDFTPRRFPRVIAGEDAPPFKHGSGRLDLAEAITASTNPLTARVLVNRIWMQHFGKGLVTTPDDFGTRSDPPSHPELLDYLAGEFLRSGWSVKHMHRLILTSATFRQQSAHRETPAKIDPENLLYWKMDRQRLDFEAMRDSLLAVSGNLRQTPHPKTIRLETPLANHVRSIYLFVDRNNLPNLFRTFDFANPDASTARRPETTVPQQALFGLNSPFMQSQAATLIQSLPADVEKPSADQRLKLLYRRVLAREPSPVEQELGLRYLNSQSNHPWQTLTQALLLTNEFLFLD